MNKHIVSRMEYDKPFVVNRKLHLQGNQQQQQKFQVNMSQKILHNHSCYVIFSCHFENMDFNFLEIFDKLCKNIVPNIYDT